MTQISIFNDRVNIWFDETMSNYEVTQVDFDLTTIPSFASICLKDEHKKTLICEINIPGAQIYALLGFEYRFLPQNHNLIFKIPKPFRGKAIKTIIYNPSYIGLEPEFSDAIYEELVRLGGVLCPGELRVSHLITSDVGSSVFVFQKIVRILIFLLSVNQIETWSKEELEEKLREIFYQKLIPK